MKVRHEHRDHFVAKAEWSDEQMLRRVCQWVVPKMDFSEGGWWIIDDTGFPKKGRHSVGVARQYCGVLGKQDNCQVVVSVSLSCSQGSLPVAWQLYLPKEWAEDEDRRRKAGVPETLQFATKTEIALEQLRRLLAEGAPRHCVLADAGYGVDTEFRRTLTEMGLEYVVGVTSAVVVWPPGVEPLPFELRAHQQVGIVGDAHADPEHGGHQGDRRQLLARWHLDLFRRRGRCRRFGRVDRIELGRQLGQIEKLRGQGVMEMMDVVFVHAFQFLVAQMLRQLLEPLYVEQREQPLVQSQLVNERDLRSPVRATARGRCRSAGHHRPSVSNISRWKSSSIRRTFHVSSAAFRFSRLLSPLT